MKEENKDIVRLKELLILITSGILILTILFFIIWYWTYPRFSSFLFWYGLITFGLLGYAHIWIVRFTIDLKELKKFIKKDINL